MLFITMVRLVQCKLPAGSLSSNTCFLGNGALKSVGLLPEKGGNCLWHTGQPSVLRFDCEQLTVPSFGVERQQQFWWGHHFSWSRWCSAPCFRSCPCCIQPWGQCPRGVGAAGSTWAEPALQNDSPSLILLQKSSEGLQQAVEGVKDSVVPLACVHSCPWVLSFLQADGHCWEVSQRRVLAFYHHIGSTL